MSDNTQAVTTLLMSWRRGDAGAGAKLAETVYGELRRIAGAYMRNERPDHTLEATALVHEMYLKLFAGEPVEWQNRAHFFAVAAQQLRRILVNHARDREAAKRGGKRVRLSLSSVNGIAQPAAPDLLDVNEAIEQLEQVDTRAARAVELRFFGGLTEEETAEALGVSLATLKRDWTFARAWLVRRLGA